MRMDRWTNNKKVDEQPEGKRKALLSVAGSEECMLQHDAVDHNTRLQLNMLTSKFSRVIT